MASALQARTFNHKDPLTDQVRSLRPLSLLHFSIASRVRLPVVVFTAWAALVYCLSLAGMLPDIGGRSASLTGILAMVTGLMVSFRSGSSYDRWYEGRRVWASIQSTSRSFVRLIVFALPPPDPQRNPRQREAMHELCALLCAFSYATMYRLRDQPGVSHLELRQLIPQDLLDAMESTPESVRRQQSIDGTVRYSSATEASRALAGANLPVSARRSIPFALSSGAPSNLPLSLIRSMHAYLNAFHATPLASEGNLSADTPALDPATWASCLGSLKELTDDLTALERIRDTPIPLVLTIHLQLLLAVYIGAVPIQLINAFGVWTIPATAIACLVFYGVDRAGEELSDPFGTEPNDLPLNKYCATIHREYLELAGIGNGSAGNDWKPGPLSGASKKET